MAPNANTQAKKASRYQHGWDIARNRFGYDIHFFAPSMKSYRTSGFRQSCDCVFAPVSITGGNCALMCEHCRGMILGRMSSTDTPEKLLAFARALKKRGARGLLVSGGSDRQGVVHLERFVPAIAEIRESMGLKVLVHTGYTNIRLARSLASAGVDGAMVDIIGDRDTLRRVYHLEEADDGYCEASLANLAEAGVPIAPHIVMGLDFGSIRSEYRAIEIAAGYPLATLVMVALRPLPGTPMATVPPPTPDLLGDLLLSARNTLPGTPILLGCERPAGEHKVKTDLLALKAGVNGIAYPAEGVIDQARMMGLRPRLSEMCCALIFHEKPDSGDER